MASPDADHAHAEFVRNCMTSLSTWSQSKLGPPRVIPPLIYPNNPSYPSYHSIASAHPTNDPSGDISPPCEACPPTPKTHCRHLPSSSSRPRQSHHKSSTDDPNIDFKSDAVDLNEVKSSHKRHSNHPPSKQLPNPNFTLLHQAPLAVHPIIVTRDRDDDAKEALLRPKPKPPGDASKQLQAHPSLKLTVDPEQYQHAQADRDAARVSSNHHDATTQNTPTPSQPSPRGNSVVRLTTIHSVEGPHQHHPHKEDHDDPRQRRDHHHHHHRARFGSAADVNAPLDSGSESDDEHTTTDAANAMRDTVTSTEQSPLLHDQVHHHHHHHHQHPIPATATSNAIAIPINTPSTTASNLSILGDTSPGSCCSRTDSPGLISPLLGGLCEDENEAPPSAVKAAMLPSGAPLSTSTSSSLATSGVSLLVHNFSFQSPRNNQDDDEGSPMGGNQLGQRGPNGPSGNALSNQNNAVVALSTTSLTNKPSNIGGHSRTGSSLSSQALTSPYVHMAPASSHVAQVAFTYSPHQLPFDMQSIFSDEQPGTAGAGTGAAVGKGGQPKQKFKMPSKGGLKLQQQQQRQQQLQLQQNQQQQPHNHHYYYQQQQQQQHRYQHLDRDHQPHQQHQQQPLQPQPQHPPGPGHHPHVHQQNAPLHPHNHVHQHQHAHQQDPAHPNIQQGQAREAAPWTALPLNPALDFTTNPGPHVQCPSDVSTPVPAPARDGATGEVPPHEFHRVLSSVSLRAGAANDDSKQRQHGHQHDNLRHQRNQYNNHHDQHHNPFGQNHAHFAPHTQQQQHDFSHQQQSNQQQHQQQQQQDNHHQEPHKQHQPSNPSRQPSIVCPHPAPSPAHEGSTGQVPPHELHRVLTSLTSRVFESTTASKPLEEHHRSQRAHHEQQCHHCDQYSDAAHHHQPQHQHQHQLDAHQPNLHQTDQQPARLDPSSAHHIPQHPSLHHDTTNTNPTSPCPPLLCQSSLAALESNKRQAGGNVNRVGIDLANDL